MAQATRKTPTKTAIPVPRPNGRGALLPGGMPGNAGGPGRPPSELRERLRGSFADRLAILEEIADDADTSPSDRIRAIDLLAKYGLGALQGVPNEVVHAKLAASIDIIEALVPADIQPNLLARLQGVWDGQ